MRASGLSAGRSVVGKLRSALVSSRGASWLVSNAAASESRG